MKKLNIYGRKTAGRLRTDSSLVSEPKRICWVRELIDDVM